MAGIPLTPVTDGVVLPVLVVPNAARAEIVGVHGDMLKLRVASPPEGGRATREAAGLLKEAFGVRARLHAGAASRRKRFLLEGARSAEIEAVIRTL